MFYPQIKRMLDVLSAGLLCLLVWPLLLVAMVLIWSIDRHSPVFAQVRVGKDRKLFSCFKLRTMREGDEPDIQRLTGLGRWLRRTSVDELLQLFNVLKGDMSLVGPRPLLPEYLALYSAHQNRRHEVLPGMTGLAQVNRMVLTDWEARLDKDVYYVDHCSFWLDLKILGLTVRELLRTMWSASPPPVYEKFKGIQK